VALVLVLGTGAVAALERRTSPATGSTRAVAAGLGDGVEVGADPSTTTRPAATAPSTTAPSAPTMSIAPTTTSAPRLPPTTRKIPPPTTVPAPRTDLPTSTLPTTVATPVVVSRTATPWTSEENGVSIRVRLDPPSPRVGEAVRFIVDATTTTTDYCCILALNVDDTSFLPVSYTGTIGCPAPAGSEAEFPWVVPASGVINVTVTASRMTACPGWPPAIVSARLYAYIVAGP
jgi:hypothetical protein